MPKTTPKVPKGLQAVLTLTPKPNGKIKATLR